MSTKEPARLSVIKGSIDGAYTVKQAARKFGVSTRRVKSLKKAVWERGDEAVIHGNAGRRGKDGRGLGNWFKPMPRLLTGLGAVFNTLCTGFRMTRLGEILRLSCASTSAFRGILRRLGRSYDATGCRRPSMPTE
ncbi:MAG: hypothetical protein LBH70_08320 [Spirochaetaceae bacterium]|jgi:hypothetical protein|nr:hypothetical protein [Spirochaetaceae bacterium]